MTVGELQQMLVAKLVRQAGGTARRWRMAIGPIRIRDAATHPHCNWEVAPSGTPRDIAEIEGLLDTVRLDHPIVTVD